MQSRVIPVPPFTLTVFGATGDLARRKLYPALWRRLLAGQMPPQSRVVGVSRRALSDDAFRQMVLQSLTDAGAVVDDRAVLDAWLAGLSYFTLDAVTADGWRDYAAALQRLPAPRLFYFAVAPTLAEALCRRLHECQMLKDDGRLILEKPFGHDWASAEALNAVVAQVAAERQVYRIDHYLGKETVQNLMALRFANALFEPIWNGRYIDHVQITVAEAIGVGGRGDYYDAAGAARDMLQNHLLQLLCLAAMEAPANYRADDVRDEKLKVLRALRPLADEDDAVVTGQYAGGNGTPSYLQDIGRAHSDTETYIAVKCAIDNWRWANTPFYLRTGKRLGARLSEIAVRFSAPPHSIFPTNPRLPENTLVIRLQPREGIDLQLNIKEPGPGGFRLAMVPLDMSFADSLGVALPDAYERLLMDVVRGDQTLFMRSDELEAAWKWVEPIICRIGQARPVPYMCGSSGPDDALRLLHADGRKWRLIG